MPAAKVAKGIYVVGGQNLTYFIDCNSYLILSPESSFLIDTGSGKGYLNLLNNIFELGVDPRSIKFILLTHCHYPNAGGTYLLKELTKALTVAHYPDSLYIRQGDIVMTDAMRYGDKFTASPISIEIHEEEFTIIDDDYITIKAIHTPGHTPGSTSYRVDLKELDLTLLFIGDALGPLSKKWKSSETDWYRSLHKILKLKIDILCTSVSCIYSNVDKIINEAIRAGPIWIN